MEQNPDEWFDLESAELDFSNDHEIIELLAGDLHCPLCGSAYDQAETRFVREREHESTLTLAVQCHCCGTGSLISIQHAPKPSARVTELTPVERAFFAYLAPINDADVRRIRKLLRRHRGDLRDLL